MIFRTDPREDPAPWRRAWQSDLGDRVLDHPERRLARVEMGEPCSGHAPDSLCLRCAGRVKRAVERAREILLARSCPEPREEPDTRSYPDMLALVNEVAKPNTAFAMKFSSARRLVAKRAFPEVVEPGKPVSLFRYTVSCKVSDSDHLREVSVAASPGLIEALSDARVSVRLDRECVVDVPFPKAVSAPGLPIPRPGPRAPLFKAVKIAEKRADPGAYLGVMPVHGTEIEVVLDDVPERVPEGGVTTEVPLARYTTKGLEDEYLVKAALKDL